MATMKPVCDKEIISILEAQKNVTHTKIQFIIQKGATANGLTKEEVAALLVNEKKELDIQIFEAAKTVKKKVYGNRIVIFAPLYLSNYCVNNCLYCGYKKENKIKAIKLTTEEIVNETKALLDMGHKRIAIEAGEDNNNCPIDYVIEAMNTIYSVRQNDSNIRRINVNIAATSIENYKRLKQAGTGTYILFQETYNKKVYEEMHPCGPKSDYNYHLTAMDRAIQAGLDDLGIGVLFGLYDYKYEVLASIFHKEHLESAYNIGPHTISVPRLKKATNFSADSSKWKISDYELKRIVAIYRLAVPYTGIILSTREPAELRRQLLEVGVSQISAGSCTGVGGYAASQNSKGSEQFNVSDHRTVNQTVLSLCEQGFIPSYCTACYRTGRTGDRFMEHAKSKDIHLFCLPNAILTFKEYLEDFAEPQLQKIGSEVINNSLKQIADKELQQEIIKRLKIIDEGKRDLFF